MALVQKNEVRLKRISLVCKQNKQKNMSVAKCRGSWVVGKGRGSWVWVVGMGRGCG